MNKRGISPIFATVLLIAFAVAIGAMIMNWSAGLSLGPSCDNTGIQSVGSACFSGNILRVELRNTGKDSVSGLVVGSEKTIQKVDLEPRGSVTAEADFSESISKRGVRVIPVVESDGEVFQCTDKAVVFDKINACS
ncbi:MAG: archaellin/type IV pilin N-terminal domain-containing protein [Candidatus Woesearchaeota archaeon]